MLLKVLLKLLRKGERKMKKIKERTILFLLSLFLIPFLLAFEPELHIIVNNEFNFQIFLKVLNLNSNLQLI